MKRTKLGVACLLGALAASALASPAFAGPYTVELSSVGDGANNGSVYYSPYVGTIKLGTTVIYSGYLICDDFNTESFVHAPWQATETQVGALDGSEKFAGATYLFNGTLYDTDQMYAAAAWLANELLLPGNVTDHSAQGTLSFAIWDIMDGTVASGDVASAIGDAFDAVDGGYEGLNVEVFTPDPLNASQEFLVVNGPSVPEPSTLALFGVGLAGVLFVAMRRRAARR